MATNTGQLWLHGRALWLRALHFFGFDSIRFVSFHCDAVRHGVWLVMLQYHVKPGFDNGEDALKAVKADLIKRNIPARYFQWDDWWMESQGDVPGMTSWTPQGDQFPSGFTNWLNETLSMYAPMYSAENVWNETYKWKVDPRGRPGHQSSLPLDPQFYQDLFANGTSIGMKMFEQDFLCSTNTATLLTNSDLTSGDQWMANMDAAAKTASTSLQWCMINPLHALASTKIHQMTNARATRDNTRLDGNNILSLGQNSLL